MAKRRQPTPEIGGSTKTPDSKKANRSIASESVSVEAVPEFQCSRHTMIEEAAYFKAEREGFQGDQLGYWLAAEKEVDTQLTTAGKGRNPGWPAKPSTATRNKLG